VINVPADEAYGLWAATYDSELNPLLALEARALVPVLEAIEPKHVVDVGCGTGRWLQRFAANGCRLVGVDASPEMLAQAQQKPGLRGKLVLGRACALPVRADWADLVLCSLSLGYFIDVQAAFREFARAARPEAWIVVSDLHPEGGAAGWTRSFRSRGVAYRIESWGHSLPSVYAAAEEAGLLLQESQALCFGANEFPLFEAAGKARVFESVKSQPALFAAVWRKRC
jgi:SAM-dependent methyltransferase